MWSTGSSNANRPLYDKKPPQAPGEKLCTYKHVALHVNVNATEFVIREHENTPMQPPAIPKHLKGVHCNRCAARRARIDKLKSSGKEALPVK